MQLYEEIIADREVGTKRLVSEYRARLTTAAEMLCRDPHEAEDLVFRAFEQAILHINDFRPTGSFYYWIYTILLNFHRMDLRKKSSRPEVYRDAQLPDIEDDKDQFAEFAFRGSAEAVRRAVKMLPDNFREVVVLRFFEEMSTAEIAKVANLPEGTVRSRLHYAKKALRAMLLQTEMADDFTERLLRSTRPKHSFFRRITVAGALCALGFAAAIAAGVGAVSVASSKKAPLPEAGREVSARGSLWNVVGGESLFSPEADEVDRAVERALKYIRSCQLPDGAFPGQYGDSAAIPALAGMAFLSKGHLPQSEPYGETILKCLDRVLATADMSGKGRFRGYMGAAGNGRMYAHAIATLFLAEMSGMVDEERQARIDRVLPLAVKIILDAQNKQKSHPSHLGGWRYNPDSSDSDLSCSGWCLMALRSARLNGMRLPSDAIEKAVLFIKRCQNRNSGAFRYQSANGQFAETLTGAAILCLELCGRHLDEDALRGADYVAKTYRHTLSSNNGYVFYALYYTSQGLFQLGGELWREFEKWMYETYIKRQAADGSWRGGGGEGNKVYTTSMAVLAFTVPYRMLPIYQRDETVDDNEEERK